LTIAARLNHATCDHRARSADSHLLYLNATAPQDGEATLAILDYQAQMRLNRLQ
jgi:hypothetical protein